MAIFNSFLYVYQRVVCFTHRHQCGCLILASAPPAEPNWLVVFRLPLWKMMEWKSLGVMKFPIFLENNPNVPNHQPEHLNSKWQKKGYLLESVELLSFFFARALKKLGNVQRSHWTQNQRQTSSKMMLLYIIYIYYMFFGWNDHWWTLERLPTLTPQVILVSFLREKGMHHSHKSSTPILKTTTYHIYRGFCQS